MTMKSAKEVACQLVHKIAADVYVILSQPVGHDGQLSGKKITINLTPKCSDLQKCIYAYLQDRNFVSLRWHYRFRLH